MTEFIEHLGVSPQFLDGSFVWDSTSSNRCGTMSSRAVIALLVAFCKLVKQPSSVAERKSIFSKLWDGSYNISALKDFVLFYTEPDLNVTSRYIHPDELEDATKDNLISLLVEWNVPFVPYTAWDEFIIRASALRVSNSSELTPLCINANRLAFYVRHGVINDSRSCLQVAAVNGISHPDDVRDYKASVKNNSDFLLELSKSFSAAPPPAKQSSKPKAAAVFTSLHKKLAKSQGIHHYNTCVKDLDTLIKNRGFINFYEYTHDRRNALKQLGCKSKPAANIGGVWISTSSPQIPDAATVLRSISNLSSGFYFYLTRLTGISRMSHLAPDRIQWWSWLAAKFSDSESALLHFVSNFMLMHHAADSWLDTAQNASQMYTDARRYGDANPLVTGSSSSSSEHRDGSTIRQKNTPVVVKQQRSIWTQQQQDAVKALKAQCPADTCSSRVISNLKCAAEKRGRKCRYSHVCGWCRSASCEAQCAKTPPSPVL
jgi:hypothetical protein